MGLILPGARDRRRALGCGLTRSWPRGGYIGSRSRRRCPLDSAPPYISPLFERVLADGVVRLLNQHAEPTTCVALFTLQNITGIRMLIDGVVVGDTASEKWQSGE